MYTEKQSNLVNDLHSRLIRGVTVDAITDEERAAVLEAGRIRDTAAKAAYIRDALGPVWG